MMDIHTLVASIINPMLRKLGMWSPGAAKLLLITAATESAFKVARQHGGGPALGVYQMEPDTYNDIWDNYLAFKPHIARKVLEATGYKEKPRAEFLEFDIHLATAMARIQYYRWPEKIPPAFDNEGLMRYYYKYWAPNPEKTSLEQATIRAQQVLGGYFDV